MILDRFITDKKMQKKMKKIQHWRLFIGATISASVDFEILEKRLCDGGFKVDAELQIVFGEVNLK